MLPSEPVLKEPVALLSEPVPKEVEPESLLSLSLLPKVVKLDLQVSLTCSGFMGEDSSALQDTCTCMPLQDTVKKVSKVGVFTHARMHKHTHAHALMHAHTHTQDTHFHTCMHTLLNDTKSVMYTYILLAFLHTGDPYHFGRLRYNWDAGS